MSRFATREVRERSSLSITVTALVTGYAVYAVARPATRSFLLWHVSAPSLVLPSQLSWLLGSAPSFLHTLAFAILLAVAIGGDRHRRFVACLAWGAIEIAAEFAQLPAAGGWLEAHAPTIAQLSIVRNFLAGTFAVADVIAALIGTTLAATCVSIRRR